MNLENLRMIQMQLQLYKYPYQLLFYEFRKGHQSKNISQ